MIGRLLCRLGWHSWVHDPLPELLRDWGVWSVTCQRCGERDGESLPR